MLEEKLLNYQYQEVPISEGGQTQTLVLLHGLFGDLNNLGGIARAFAQHYNILRIDLRNHGQSFHSNEMDYPLMAQDIDELLTYLQIEQAIVVGHSMGGKTAMMFTHLFPKRVAKLIVIDIAPVEYTQNRHETVFQALFAVKNAKPKTRQQAQSLMSEYIQSQATQQFMLKSFDPNREEYFKFNLSVLKHNYSTIMGWQAVAVEKPTLFIKGELSDYLQKSDTNRVLAQFPNAKLFVVSNADHWVHAEKAETVVRAIQRFLSE